MKHRVCKCCGKKIVGMRVMQPATDHLCHECASAEDLARTSMQEQEIKDKTSKIIFLDRFR